METRDTISSIADLFVPDGASVEAALSRVTHLAIGAHQDDLEIFAYHGIAECYESAEQWFAGVTVTDGGGSARAGRFADYSDDEMKAVRAEEQREAARLGRYSLQAQLGYTSKSIKVPGGSAKLVDQLEALLRAARPKVLYLHNPADKHDTHIAVLSHCVAALRRLPTESRPERVLGCEVWRDLDWLDDTLKVPLPVDTYPDLAKDLIAVFESQVAGGKDYVAATLGRRRANATFFEPRAVDAASAYTFALDLMPLVANPVLSIAAFTERLVDRFRSDVVARIRQFDT